MHTAILRTVHTVLAVVLIGAICSVAFVVVRGELRESVYRDRLASLSHNYNDLHQRYTQAISQTAITELIVQDNSLSVRIVTSAGNTRLIPTPYDPSREIYADYAIINGRVILRRVFDDQTPPSEALIIDPELVGIDWDAPDATVGKAVYRSLNEGRWTIAVTGNGSLGLTPSINPNPAALSPPPEIHTPDEILGDVITTTDSIDLGDVVRWTMRRIGLARN